MYFFEGMTARVPVVPKTLDPQTCFFFPIVASFVAQKKHRSQSSKSNGKQILKSLCCS